MTLLKLTKTARIPSQPGLLLLREFIIVTTSISSICVNTILWGIICKKSMGFILVSFRLAAKV